MATTTARSTRTGLLRARARRALFDALDVLAPVTPHRPKENCA
ncbi:MULTISPECIES: hypothetical protein [Actinomycetes]|uniref:Uncharacterized protein n=1 Tax=Streptomyces nondiastaticus TaxID=3154512 RepID=A0ABW6TWF1_9ACTN|nr:MULTISPECIES: hypothetical protein [Actinomycetes]WKU44915.1 hypothetical protein Q3V23_13000 [Streptomyces sp. VNUA116]